MDRNPAPSSAHTLARLHGWAGWWLPGMLLVSFVCNVLAVSIPFLEINAFLRPKRTYSLPHSVELMWASGLYAAAIAVVAFSIVFPFFKLFSLTYVWFRVTDMRRRRRWIEVLEYLGKWSYLDIYLVVVILVLTNDQFFISASPLAGVYFFIAAITLSMLSSLAMERLTRPGAVAEAMPVQAREPRWVRLALPGLLLITLVSLIAAMGLPFLRIDQFLLAGRAHSIIASVGALWRESHYVMSVLVMLFLVAMPLLMWSAMAVLWWVRHTPEQWARWRQRASTTEHWAMIDVFALALLLFLVEGRTLVKTEIQPGLYLVVAASAVALACFWTTRAVVRSERTGTLL